MTQTGTGSTRSTSTSFGTVGWARRRGGQLTRGEKLREFANANRVLLRTAPAQVRMRLGLPNSKARSFDIDAIPVPDSKIAREAEEQARPWHRPGRIPAALPVRRADFQARRAGSPG